MIPIRVTRQWLLFPGSDRRGVRRASVGLGLLVAALCAGSCCGSTEALDGAADSEAGEVGDDNGVDGADVREVLADDVEGDVARVVSLSIEPASSTLAGRCTIDDPVDTIQLVAIATHDDGMTADVTTAATWRSSDPAVATVDGGLVAGVAVGSGMSGAGITAAFGDVVSDPAFVFVAVDCLESIAVAPTTATLCVGSGETVALTATGHLPGGASMDVTESATWSSDDDTVATVSDAPGSRGVVTAGDALTGVAQIVATLGGVVSSPAIISVTTCDRIIAFEVFPATAAVPAGMAQGFTAVAEYWDGRTADVTATSIWSSSDESVAMVDADGWAAGIAPGTARISATFGGLTGFADLTVTAPLVASIVVTPSVATIPIGFTQAFVATGTFTDGRSLDLTSDPRLTWSSSNTGVATISNEAGSQGVATVVSSGTATIVARFVSGPVDVSGTATQVGMSCDPFGPLTVSPATATVAVGSTTALTAVSGTTCMTEMDVTVASSWTSSDPTVASVAGGVVTGVSPGGPVTITASFWMLSDAASVTVVP